MANSSYYYKLYTQYKKETDDYEKNIKELNSIKNDLAGNFYDEQRNVNAELEDLEEDLKKSVRHDSEFKNNANRCQNYKEKAVTADGKLNNAITALENEIAALNIKKRTAEQNRDSNYKKYESQKQAELQELYKAMGS